MFKQSTKNILVAGHRGMAALYPENTMLGFKKAVEAGVDMIETDINMTKDGVLVVMHDNSVDRTTNGSGKIRNITTEEFLALDAGCKFYKECSNSPIPPPTFKEFLEYVVTTNIFLNIEIKDTTFETTRATIKMLDDFGMRGKYVIACFDANIVQYAHEKLDAPTQGFPSSYMSNFSNETYENMYATGINMKDVSVENCKYFRSLGIDAWGWCPDNREQAQFAVDCGVSLVTCNNPLPAIKLYKELGLHK